MLTLKIEKLRYCLYWGGELKQIIKFRKAKSKLIVLASNNT